MTLLSRLFPFLAAILFTSLTSHVKTVENDTLIIRKTDDFKLSGAGSDSHWNKASWVRIPLLKADPKGYETKAKLLYSDTGIYFLFFCEDKKITATLQADFLELWNEDVIEVFLQPDPAVPSYFEYELSPLNFELPIVIHNEKGNLNSWMPFNYISDRKTRHIVTVQGGAQKSGANIQSWTSEIFIPYKLLKPVLIKAPTSGTRWKGNLYRIDYDRDQTLFAWQPNSGSFHEYEKFGFLQFE